MIFTANTFTEAQSQPAMGQLNRQGVASKKPPYEPLGHEPNLEAVDWGNKDVPGPFDAKTLQKDTTSPKTSHDDEINDYPKDMTDGGESEGDSDKDLREKKLSVKSRKKSATIKPSAGHSSGRFPMPDKKHARLAIQMLPKANGMSPEDEAKVRARAKKILGHSTPSMESNDNHDAWGKFAGSHGKTNVVIHDGNHSKKGKFSKKERSQVTHMHQAVRESLTFHPRFLEGSYDPEKRTADVIIITEGKGNKRDAHYYGADTIQSAVAERVFEGAQAYADHPSLSEETDRPERSVRDLFGYYFDTKYTQFGGKAALQAKLKIQEGQDWAVGLIKEAIEYNKKFPDKQYAGISINADGDVSPGTANGEQVNYVHKITDAFSADLVTKPARGGRFLALVESQHGSNSKGVSVDKKLIEAAERLRKQAEGGEIDNADLAVLLEAVDAAKDMAGKGEFGESKGSDDGVSDARESATKEAGIENFGGKKAKPFGKKADDMECNEAKDGEMDDKSDDGDDDGDEDGGEEIVIKKAKGKESMAESDVRVTHESLYKAALAEAEKNVAADTKATVVSLKSEIAALRAAQGLRESIEVAKTKLKESTLPEVAAKRLMKDLIGKSAAEMDSLIETEVAYFDELGVKPEGKRVAGNPPKSVSVRESEDKSNTATIFAGIGL